MSRRPAAVSRAGVPDHVLIRPADLAGTVTVPGDKSMSHRALMLGALAGDATTVEGLADSGDVAATASALRSMGATVALAPAADGNLSGRVGGPLREATDIVDCGNSGTSLRLLAGVAAGVDGLTVFTGDTSLRRRPVARVCDPLRAMGVECRARADGSLLPLVVVGGRPAAVEYRNPIASAQIKSCVLLAGLRADGPTVVLSPSASRDHTERMLAFLGADVDRRIEPGGAERVTIRPGPLRSMPITVPTDPSSAAFWIVAAVIGSASAGITVAGVGVNPTRTGFLRILEAMGAGVSIDRERDVCGEPVADLSAQPSSLNGTVVEGPAVVDALDELPVLALAGMISEHGIEVRDAAELRVKESDRIASTAAALRALGVEVEERADGYRVPGRQSPTGGIVHADGDHRIAMMAAIAGTIASAPVEITGFATVGSSYPTFLEDLARLGGDYDVCA